MGVYAYATIIRTKYTAVRLLVAVIEVFSLTTSQGPDRRPSWWKLNIKNSFYFFKWEEQFNVVLPCLTAWGVHEEIDACAELVEDIWPWTSSYIQSSTKHNWGKCVAKRRNRGENKPRSRQILHKQWCIGFDDFVFTGVKVLFLFCLADQVPYGQFSKKWLWIGFN